MNINSLADLEKAIKLINDTVNQGITEELQDFTNDTQNRVPVVTGQLKSSYKVDVNGSNQFNGGTISPIILREGNNNITLSYNTEYAEFAHENAKNPSQRGYFLMPYNNWINGLEDRLQARIDKL